MSKLQLVKPCPPAPDLDLTPGPCLWCGQHVESDRETTGATTAYDASWTVPGSGDFGCFESPDTCEDGVGDHMRPTDVRHLLKVADARSRAGEELARWIGHHRHMLVQLGIEKSADTLVSHWDEVS